MTGNPYPGHRIESDRIRRVNRDERGVALAAVVILTMVVVATVAAYLTVARAEIVKAKIHPARTRALYAALGQLHQARLMISESTYDTEGRNEILSGFASSTLPGTRVEVVDMSSGGNDPYGIFYTLVAKEEVDGVTVTARQLVSERESFSTYLAMVSEADLGISGIEDENYNPENPSPVPPGALSQGKIHTNNQMELFFSGYRHFLNPVSGGVEGGDWVYQVGADPEKQIFWFPEESRPDAPDIPFPKPAEFDQIKQIVTSGTVTTVVFPESWANGLVTRNENGYHICGDVNVLVQFSGSSGNFTLALRERGGSGRTTTLSGLAIPAHNAGIVFVENGFNPQTTLTAPNQTVHLKGDIKGRLTVFAATGDARIAGNLRYVDDQGRPAAVKDQQGMYKKNPDYTGNTSLGVIAEFDVRFGIKPVTENWPATRYHIDPETGNWVTTEYPGLEGQPVGPKSNTVPVEENLFGYLGGTSGNDDSEIHGALFARQGRIYSDGMNPLNYSEDTWGFRAGWDSTWVTPYGRNEASILRFGALVCSRRPVTQLVDSNGNTIVGWGHGQSIFDEDMALNSPPFYFRHNLPVFYEIEISDMGGL